MMKRTQKNPNRTLNATARRAPAAIADDYDEEPSMKLSSAFVVVLLLHLVAVGGVFAFNSIKARRSSDLETVQASELVSAPPQVQQATAPSSGNVYEVRPGDTLIRIANSYGVDVDAIEKANGLRNVEVLRVGQEIRIPEVGKSLAVRPAPAHPDPRKTVKEAPPVSAPAAGLSDGRETYTVQKGDNPVAIARHLGVKYSDLIDLNKIEDPRLLQIGQLLKIPKKRD